MELKELIQLILKSDETKLVFSKSQYLLLNDLS